MKKSTLILVYLITAFMAGTGFEIIRFGGTEFSIFQVTNFIYALASLFTIHWLFQKIWNKRNLWNVALVIFLYFLFFISFRYLVEEVITKLLIGYGNYNPNTPVTYYIKDNIYYASVYFMYGIILFLIDKQIENQKKQAELLAQSHKTELDFLRLQISPHFLFNSLNSIYALAYKNSEKTPEAVLQLSDLMRYMLYEKGERISLEKEWDMVLNFIELQKLRMSLPLQMDMKTPDSLPAVEIPPYILIPFFENAFKHGFLTDSSHPMKVTLELTKNQLLFSLENKIGNQQKDKGSGIGIENVRKRLEILYPDKHRFKTLRKDGNFIVELEIPTHT